MTRLQNTRVIARPISKFLYFFSIRSENWFSQKVGDCDFFIISWVGWIISNSNGYLPLPHPAEVLPNDLSGPLW